MMNSAAALAALEELNKAVADLVPGQIFRDIHGGDNRFSGIGTKVKVDHVVQITRDLQNCLDLLRKLESPSSEQQLVAEVESLGAEYESKCALLLEARQQLNGWKAECDSWRALYNTTVQADLSTQESK